MALRNPPFAIAAGCYSDADLRSYFATMGGAQAQGVIGDGTQLAASAPGGMVVRIAPGKAWVAGSDLAGQGMYLVENTTNTDVTIATANGANPRIDKIVAKITDPA